MNEKNTKLVASIFILIFFLFDFYLFFISIYSYNFCFLLIFQHVFSTDGEFRQDNKHMESC